MEMMTSRLRVTVITEIKDSRTGVEDCSVRLSLSERSFRSFPSRAAALWLKTMMCLCKMVMGQEVMSISPELLRHEERRFQQSVSRV
ncbi:hypothetical protein EYF80_040858 [Liparis tanakae]|uniref:Uncharacterized protein n=1 Tax=Liparis tanakae TaxID=230148 RepID=A0A4Z2G5X0_9TELE|nr:hypothetical protein EYF80_040858 [Liparis tanakae]